MILFDWEHKAVTLPDDSIVMPCYYGKEEGLKLNYSPKTGLWFVTLETYGEIRFLSSGSWLDCSIYFDLDYQNAPFKWGKSFPGKVWGQTLTPFFELMPVPGKIVDDVETYTKKAEYSILVANLPAYHLPETAQHNEYSYFEVIHCDSLPDLVKVLETKTNMIF